MSSQGYFQKRMMPESGMKKMMLLENRSMFRLVIPERKKMASFFTSASSRQILYPRNGRIRRGRSDHFVFPS
jgi:hypothetical protein